ncbi:unnamed protein product, partial [Effrenium voratum]
SPQPVCSRTADLSSKIAGTMPAKLIFTVKSETHFGQTTKIIGSDPTMGGWCVDKAMPLTTDASTYPLWVGEAELDITEGQSLEYKFVKVQPDGNVVWEPGNNRLLRFDNGEMFSAVGPVGQRESVFGVMDGSGPRLASGRSAPEAQAGIKPGLLGHLGLEAHDNSRMTA